MAEELHEVALTDAEKDAILAHCGPEPLLVGGQALAFWALWFKVETPAELGEKVTTDADFIGSRSHALALNRHLRWTIWEPAVDDSTVQTAKLSKRVENNGIKQIDFLSSIVGLKTEDVRQRAVSVTLSTGAMINILHPVDVLASRLRNLQFLTVKQNEIGVAQARLAIRIVQAYLESLCTPEQQRELLRSIERVAEFALDPSLGDTLDRYDLDPLQAVPVGKIEIPEFKAKRWSQLLRRSQEARSARARKAIQLETRRSTRNKK